MNTYANISSINEYIEIIQKLQKDYPSGENIDSTNRSFLNRGISDSNYKLLPKVLRGKNDNINKYFKNFNKFIGNSYEKLNKLLMEKSSYTEWVSEKELLEQFIQEASGYVDIPPNDLTRWAEYAQHYGVPTRFLDWSTNPMTALYFAIREHHNNNVDGSVWMLHKQNYEYYWGQQPSDRPDRLLKDAVYSLSYGSPNKVVNELLGGIYYSKIKYPFLYAPYYVDSRMSAQGSYFMVWGIIEIQLEKMLEEAPKLPTERIEITHGINTDDKFNDECYMKYDANNDNIPDESTKNNAMLFRFNISATAKQKIQRDLDLIGINEKTLFPGLDGIGKYIEMKNRKLIENKL